MEAREGCMKRRLIRAGVLRVLERRFHGLIIDSNQETRCATSVMTMHVSTPESTRRLD